MKNASPVEALLFAALEKSDQAERAAFLDSACGGDAELRASVEKLLKAHANAGDFLQKPAVEQLAGAQDSSDATQALEPSTDDKGDNVTRTVGPAASEDENSDLGFLQPSTRPDSLGRLGHYEVLQVLGKGGFGIVFRAFDDMLQRVVALKAMAPTLAATSPARKRFLREARTSAQVRHENVVQVYEVAEQPLPYLAMEFIPGETLKQRLDRVGPLDVPETLRIGRQIAEGLAAAHAMDLIHRDIKPANVLLEGGQHKAKITDFGLARAADDASISQSGIIAGTPMYMAPEQAEGKTLDQRADLFSLGSVLYQMVSGRPPFRANTTVAVLKRVAEDKPRSIREITPETPQWLCDIIAKLHAKNPDDRFQSAREVADVLADCEAKLKAKQEIKNVLPAAETSDEGRELMGGKKWVAAFAFFFLFWLALVVAEFTGVTHLFRDRDATPIAKGDPPRKSDPIKTDDPPGEQAELDRWVQRIAALPAAEQVEQVRTELVRRNPGFDGKTMQAKIEGDVVTELRIVSDKVTDIAPIRVFNALRVLECSGTGWRTGLLADLTPLQGMNLAGLKVLKLHDTRVTDEGMFYFKDCKHLTELSLHVTQVGDAGMVHFKDCKALTALDLAGTKVSDVGLVHFKDCIALTNIDLAWTKVTDVGLANFRDCRNVTSLGLHFCRQVTDAGLAKFNECKNLTRLVMSGTQVTGAGLAHSKYLENLFKLVITDTEVDDAALAHLKDCKALVILHLDTTKVTDAGMAYLKDCKNLANLYLANTQVGDSGLAHLKGCKALTILNLATTKVTDAGLAYLINYKNLTNLGLDNTQVGDAGLAHLNGVPLRSLSINKTAITDLAPLRGMPLESILLTPKNITNGLDILRDMKSLKTIGIHWEQTWPAAEFWERYEKGEFADKRDSDRRAADYLLSNGGAVKVNGQNQAIMAAADLPNEAFRLTGVRLWNADGNKVSVTDEGLAVFKDCKNVTEIKTYGTKWSDAGLAHFKNCKDLTHVSLELCGAVTDEGLAAFKDCKNLKSLRLTHTPLTGTGLAHFKDCKDLTSVLLTNTQVNDDALLHFKDLKNLKRLALHNSKVTDAGLAHLAGLSALIDLDLRGTKVTAKGLEVLAKALPKCKITWADGVIEPTASLVPDRRAAKYVLSIDRTVREAKRRES